MKLKKRWIALSLAFLILSQLSLPLLADDDDDDDDEEEGVAVSTLQMPDSKAEDEEEDTGRGLLGNFNGWLEMRPSWTVTDPAFHTENEVGLQYGLQNNLSLGYTQEFSNHYLPLELRHDGEEPDSKFRLGSGYAFAEQKKLAKGKYWAIDYAPRVYFPTAEWDKAARLQIATQQYLKFTLNLNEHFDFFFHEAPLFALYENAGFEGPEGLQANRSVENRIEVGVNANFYEGRLAFKVPLILQNIHYNDYHPEATNNARWVHLLWFYPEVITQVSDNLSTGFAYYTDSLTDDRLSHFDLKKGFEEGVVQFIFQASL